MKSERLFKDKCLYTTQRSSSDIITTLPQTIIDTILCLLPIEEAARTSILSSEWRYKWTKIPKLVFSTPSGGQLMETNKLFCAIHQVMLLHNDPIHEFTLRIEDVVNPFSKFGYDFYEVDQIILHLSRYHKVKSLTLQFDECGGDGATYSLPFSIFSMHHLTELDLTWCGLDHQPTFNGFANLTTLFLHCVRISRKTLLHLLSNSPLLKSFSLVSNFLLILLGFGHLSKYNKLLQFMLEVNIIGSEKSTMNELFGCLPAIEYFETRSDIIPWFVPDLVPQKLTTSLIHLKFFRLEETSFYNDGCGLTFLAVMIKNSPNLEELELEIETFNYHSNEEHHWDIWLEYLKDVRLEHLIELTIENYSNLESELKFVKFILARSPKLKCVSIKSEIEKSKILQTLLRVPHASVVEIDVWRRKVIHK